MPWLTPSVFAAAALHRVDDVLIAGAAAEIAFEAVADLFVGRIGIALEQLLGRHDHAGSAEAALEAMLVPEGFLHGVELAVGGEAFDGHHLAAIRLDGEHGAGLYGLAVERHGAGAADGGFAADVAAGESDDFAQKWISRSRGSTSWE